MANFSKGQLMELIRFYMISYTFSKCPPRKKKILTAGRLPSELTSVAEKVLMTAPG